MAWEPSPLATLSHDERPELRPRLRTVKSGPSVLAVEHAQCPDNGQNHVQSCGRGWRKKPTRYKPTALYSCTQCLVCPHGAIQTVSDCCWMECATRPEQVRHQYQAVALKSRSMQCLPNIARRGLLFGATVLLRGCVRSTSLL